MPSPKKQPSTEDSAIAESGVEEYENDDSPDESYEPVLFKYNILSYGADYPVDGLVKRLKQGDIYNPSFQRFYVWKIDRASRFIESLLLGLPVPGIFLSKDNPSQRLLVIDGQQRLRTLQGFYDGIFGDTDKVFALTGAKNQFFGLTYRTLSDEDRRTLDDAIIHATIVRQEVPSDDNSSIYYIFERLNTGGVELSPQEIRACIYHGDFSNLLTQLNDDQRWQELVGGPNERQRDKELILRFFALYFSANSYEKPMKDFLNRFIARHRDFATKPSTDFQALFRSVTDTTFVGLGRGAFRPRGRINSAVAEAIMVGLGNRLKRGAVADHSRLTEAYQGLVHNEQFMAACLKSTTDEESVTRRLAMAKTAFSDVE